MYECTYGIFKISELSVTNTEAFKNTEAYKHRNI